MAEILSYRRNSAILLEFRPFDEENVEIPLDSAPTAVFNYIVPGGSLGIQNVILDPSVTGSYENLFVIPDHWLYGEYTIVYTYISNELEYQREVSFILENTEDLKEDETFFAQQILDEIWAEEYIPSHNQQVTATTEVSGHEIRITLQGNALYNHDYKVILDGVKSLTGDTLAKQVVSTYQSEYGPLFATPNDVHSVLKGLYKFYEIKEVYIALRDAGQKALVMLRQQADINNSRYREYSDRNSNYFALTKYAVYEASYNLLLDLYNKFLAANGVPGYLEEVAEEDPLAKILGSGFTLGDFTISGIGDGTGDDEDSDIMDVVDSFMKKLKYVLDGIRKELKFWQDSMMSRNARGYTNSSSSTFKSSVTSPESREF